MKATGRTIVQNEVGLHARPAAVFVKTAAKLDANIYIQKGGKKAPADSITHVLTLDVRQGDEIKIIAEGNSGEKALKAMIKLVESGFESDET